MHELYLYNQVSLLLSKYKIYKVTPVTGTKATRCSGAEQSLNHLLQLSSILKKIITDVIKDKIIQTTFNSALKKDDSLRIQINIINIIAISYQWVEEEVTMKRPDHKDLNCYRLV